MGDETSSALPFLVTHWLSNYRTNDPDQQDAVDRIRGAAAELSSAFSSLGCFGTRVAPSFESEGQSVLESRAAGVQNATFADVKRNWSTCPPEHLAHLVQSSLAASQAADQAVDPEVNPILQATDAVVKKRRNPESGGRTLEDAIKLEEDGEKKKSLVISTFQRPVILESQQDEASKSLASSQLTSAATKAGDKMRHYLDLRDTCTQETAQNRSIHRSLEHHRSMLTELSQQRTTLLPLQMDATAKCNQLDEIKENEENCNRVMAQLQRQLSGLQRSTKATELVQANQEARTAYQKVRHLQTSFRNPVGLAGPKSNRVLWDVCNRQTGRSRLRMPHSRKALLFHRLRHAATINTHLSYPVYCLRFDQTGRYFISGADDYLVRVFCLGSHVIGDKAKSVRGAVLVCTLRGHAGVINNIDVSPDNAFLATASEDGDVRVWGLKDGFPIAILRGHKGGANTVVWSETTPYRLVTAGGDGQARIWDIRGACLKRYSKVIGKRPEYNVRENKRSGLLESPSAAGTQARAEPVALPPIPMRQAEQAPAVPIPPLPPAAGNNAPLPNNNNAALPAAGGQAAIDPGDAALGRFVANDSIDEGVKLIHKLQHGTPQEEQLNGPGTRSRRSPVKVLCVARCPHGNHFATGSDDGVCRIWQDENDVGVAKVDQKYSDWSTLRGASVRDVLLEHTALWTSPLLTLKGHLSAITDLDYSNQGDRILSASQKDGVVRIWSWSVDPSQRSIKKPSHILIKLSNPRAQAKNAESRSGSRRRPARAAPSKISCDVAAWVQDDSMVITSQSQLEKQSGSEIVPGSQYIFLWGSHTGHCLMGIAGAHTMQCPVVIPHPVDPSILCSAGADGCTKLWDLSTGKCVSQFHNKLEFGPMDIRDKGKPCGFLDGAFSPDGMSLVLTDDSGRISVFDCPSMDSEPVDTVGKDTPWIREQYFANDYYELQYDQNGYCVERGSELPPHLAPRGVRCSNSGSAWPSFVTETFRGLQGPLPIGEETARWGRQNVRFMCSRANDHHFSARGNLIGQFDQQTTVMFGEFKAHVSQHGTSALVATSPVRTQRESSHRMSNNYRWRDYSDLLQAEGGGEDEMELDDDDEDFEINETRARVLQEDSEEDMEIQDDTPIRATSRTRRRSAGVDEPPTRSSSRRRRRTYIDTDSESESEGGLTEWMSTNNTPSGPFVNDYDLCFFRVTDTRSHAIERLWARRLESNSSYSGRKSYTPQVGDTVVYIPRAHFETISNFPTLDAPWQSWPEEAAWPVVKCCVRNVRYRFPFKAYYGRCTEDQPRSTSVVAILTLELTGIPELSHNRSVSWPKASFIQPTRAHRFELSLFESEQADFVIPIGLYTSRLQQLEEALAARSGSLDIEAYYKEGNHEDSELQPFLGRIDRVTGVDDVNEGESHVCGSGYHSVSVVWEEGEYDQLSPWEIRMRGFPVESGRKSLNEDEKRRVRDSLKAIREVEVVEGLFLHPVDEVSYTDYRSRVEVPMDISFMTSRLDADYYSNLWSVVADMKLIKENCLKYNGENHEASGLAKNMLERFEELVLNADELGEYRRIQKEVESHAREDAANSSEAAVLSAPSNSRPTIRQSQRQRNRAGRSSLENLPPPRPLRSRNTRAPMPAPRPEMRTRLQARSVLEEVPPARTLEDLSGSSRGRASQPSNGIHRSLRSSQRPSQQRETRASSSRAALRERTSSPGRPGLRSGDSVSVRREPISYADQPSDIDDTGDDQRTNRRTARTGPAPPNVERRDAGERLDGQQNTSRATRAARRSLFAGAAEQSSASSSRDRDGEARRSTRSQVSTRQHSSLYRDSSSGELEEGDVLPRRRNGSRATTGPNLSSDGESFHQDDEASDEESVELDLEEESGGSSDEEEINRGRATRRTSRSATVRATEPSSRGTRRVTRGSPPSVTPAARRATMANPSPNSPAMRRATRAKPPPGSPNRRSSVRAIPPVANQTSTNESSVVRSGQKRKAAPQRRSSRKTAALEDESVGASEVVASRTRAHDSPETGGRKRRRASVTTYEDPSSSEFDSDDAVLDDGGEEESPPPAKPRGRRGSTGSKGRGSRHPNKRTKATASPVQTEVPKPWPDIETSKITSVSKEILERMRAIDENGIFAAPVAEAYPDLAEDYLAVIEEPMDFRTIEEDHLPRYSSIADLQQDLMLIFNNCLSFNETDNELSETARTMLGMLQDVFIDVCKEQDVLLPRRWPKN